LTGQGPKGQTQALLRLVRARRIPSPSRSPVLLEGRGPGLAVVSDFQPGLRASPWTASLRVGHRFRARLAALIGSPAAGSRDRWPGSAATVAHDLSYGQISDEGVASVFPGLAVPGRHGPCGFNDGFQAGDSARSTFSRTEAYMPRGLLAKGAPRCGFAWS